MHYVDHCDNISLEHSWNLPMHSWPSSKAIPARFESSKHVALLSMSPCMIAVCYQVMPDPSSVKQPDTATTLPEHPALRRADQLPGSHIAACTRTATGITRSRSSYSGGSGGEPPAVLCGAMPAARSGSTATAARLHSAAQVGSGQLNSKTAEPQYYLKQHLMGT